MVATHTTIKVTPESTLTDVLAAAASEPVVLDKDGMRFRVTREDDIWAGYDPQRVRETIREMAGSLSLEEGERIKKLIYQGRDEGAWTVDPERVRAVLDATAGSWSDIDADQVIAELYEERITGSRSYRSGDQ